VNRRNYQKDFGWKTKRLKRSEKKKQSHPCNEIYVLLEKKIPLKL